MKKINFKQFRHLMSAMLFILETLDKDEQIHELYVQYKEQDEPDPIVWTREALKGCKPGTHDLYVRRTFSQRTYREATSYLMVI